MDKLFALHNSLEDGKEQGVLDFTPEEKEEILSTLRVLKKDTSFEAKEEEFSTLCFKPGMSEDKVEEAKMMFLYTEDAEIWEKNILALEKGEWTESMDTKVFKRWNKSRPSLMTLLAVIFGAEEPTEESANETPGGPGDGAGAEGEEHRHGDQYSSLFSQLGLGEVGMTYFGEKLNIPVATETEGSSSGEDTSPLQQSDTSQRDSYRLRATTLEDLDKWVGVKMERRGRETPASSSNLTRSRADVSERNCLSDSEENTEKAKAKKKQSGHWLKRRSEKKEMPEVRAMSASVSDGRAEERAEDSSKNIHGNKSFNKKGGKSKPETKPAKKDKRSDLIMWLLAPHKGIAGLPVSVTPKIEASPSTEDQKKRGVGQSAKTKTVEAYQNLKK